MRFQVFSKRYRENKRFLSDASSLQQLLDASVDFEPVKMRLRFFLLVIASSSILHPLFYLIGIHSPFIVAGAVTAIIILVAVMFTGFESRNYLDLLYRKYFELRYSASILPFFKRARIAGELADLSEFRYFERHEFKVTFAIEGFIPIEGKDYQCAIFVARHKENETKRAGVMLKMPGFVDMKVMPRDRHLSVMQSIQVDQGDFNQMYKCYSKDSDRLLEFMNQYVKELLLSSAEFCPNLNLEIHEKQGLFFSFDAPRVIDDYRELEDLSADQISNLIHHDQINPYVDQCFHIIYELVRHNHKFRRETGLAFPF